MENVFDTLMEREKLMEKYYRDLAEKVTDKGIRSILLMIAEEEGKHHDHFEGMKKEISDMDDSELLVDSKKILKDIKASKDISNIDSNQLALYEKIRDEEKASEELFKGLAEKESDPMLKAIYEDTAKEENRHFKIMDEICEFIARPNDWVESSEFSSLDEY